MVDSAERLAVHARYFAVLCVFVGNVGGKVGRRQFLFFFSSRRRHTSLTVTGVQTCALPIPTRRYKSTGWASLTEADGPPAWDVVAAHRRSLGRVRIAARARVKVVGRKGE